MACYPRCAPQTLCSQARGGTFTGFTSKFLPFYWAHVGQGLQSKLAGARRSVAKSFRIFIAIGFEMV